MLAADIVFLIICLVLYAFFSGMETAFYAANRLRIELSHQQGSDKARILSKYFKNPSSFIITCLVGNTIVATIIAFRLSHYILPWLYPNIGAAGAIVVDVFLVAGLLLITAEFLPKSVFKVYADEVMPFFAKPFNIFYKILQPIVIAVEKTGKGILRLAFRHPFSTDDSRFSMEELEHIIKDHSPAEQHESEIDTELFENALEFRHLKVHDCMIHRSDIVCIEMNSPIQILTDLIVESNHSRIIVYKNVQDNIVGYVHHFDLHKNPKSIESILIPIRSVQESLGLDALLRHFIRTRKNIAIVVDEQGIMTGLITMEDILEEIFGEIEDEYDNAELVEESLAPGQFIFSGRLELDYLNKKYALELNIDQDAETLDDLVTYIAGTIPLQGTVLKHGDHTFTILEATDTRIDLIKLETAQTAIK